MLMKTFLVSVKEGHGIIKLFFMTYMGLYLKIFVTECQYRCEMVFVLHAYDNIHEKNMKWALTVEYSFQMILQYICLSI